MDCGVESGDPMLDVGVCPAVRDVVLQGWVWRLQDVSRLVCWWGWWVGWVARACGAAGALHGGEGIAQVVELLFCSGKLVCGGFECS